MLGFTKPLDNENLLLEEIVNWRVVQGSGLLIEQHGEWCVVYNIQSGETHQLNEFSLFVLKKMMLSSFTVGQLTEETCRLYQQDNKNEIISFINQLIKKFDHIGLIEPSY